LIGFALMGECCSFMRFERRVALLVKSCADHRAERLVSEPRENAESVIITLKEHYGY